MMFSSPISLRSSVLSSLMLVPAICLFVPAQAGTGYIELSSFLRRNSNEGADVSAEFQELVKSVDAAKAPQAYKNYWLYLILRSQNVDFLDLFFKSGLGTGIPADEMKALQDKLVVQSIYNAIRSGNFDKANELIPKALDLNQSLQNDATISSVVDDLNPQRFSEEAVQAEAQETMKLLLKHGYDINKLDYRGTTPLMRAAQGCDVQRIQFLVDSGADINAADFAAYTALSYGLLYQANIERQAEAVDCLLKLGAKADNVVLAEKGAKELFAKKDAKGLCEFIRKSHEDKLAALQEVIDGNDKATFVSYVKKGGVRDVLLSSKSGILQSLYRNENFGYAMIKKLVMANCPYYSQALQGFSIDLLLEYAVASNDANIIKNLMSRIPALKAYQKQVALRLLKYAVKYENEKFVKVAIDAGADVDAAWDYEGPSALPSVLRNRNFSLAKYLVEQGAQMFSLGFPSAPMDSFLRIPLRDRNQQYYDMLEAMFKKGESPNILGFRDEGFYSNAVEIGDDTLLALTKKYGGSMKDLEAYWGDSPFLKSKLSKSHLLLSRYLKNGLSPSLVKSFNLSDLTMACLLGDQAKVKELIAKGADVNASSKGFGKDERSVYISRPIYAAIGDLEILKILHQAGAKLDELCFLRELVENYRTDVLQYMIDQKIPFDVDKFASYYRNDYQYDDGKTLLILLRAGADINKKLVGGEDFYGAILHDR